MSGHYEQNKELPETQYSKVYTGTDYTDDEKEFIEAMEQYMATYKRRFPSFTEVLWVAKALGYRKVVPPRKPLPSPEPSHPLLAHRIG